MPSNAEHIQLIYEITEAYQSSSNIYDRENACQRVKLRYALAPIEDGDLFAGRYINLAVGFSPQESGGLAYVFDARMFDHVYNNAPAEEKPRLADCKVFWQGIETAANIRKAYPKEIAEVLPSDEYADSEGAAFPLCRLSGTHLDYGKLVTLGINGLKELIHERGKANPDRAEFYRAATDALDIFIGVCGSYAEEADRLGYDDIAITLKNIAVRKPVNLREAIQLVHLYAVVSGSLNYGRMDDYLGVFTDADDPMTLEYLLSLWRLINARRCTWDGRVILGGLGRVNEQKADEFAILAMEASRLNHDILPQLTLRFHDKQNPALLKKAYDNFADGCVYPMLYRDEINIEAVKRAFSENGGISDEEAIEFVPFGCGEYIINHRSLGTPSGVINLLKSLEEILFNCDLNQYTCFDKLFDAYKANVEKYISALAWQEAFEYKFAGEQAPFLYISILYDDCIERGKPLLDGGVRYLGGTLECYGNTNAADSLTAIKKLVYDDKLLSLTELAGMLKNNYMGYERERKLLVDCPKYGNDDDYADAMAVRVHEHVCNFTKGLATKNGLHSYLIVIINNNMNTIFGKFTGASADGRMAGEPMANANNPSGGMDKNGVTAFLNSLVKLDNGLHAGAVQNIKFSREMFNKYRMKTEMLMTAYFQKGQQAMLNLVSAGELEDALQNPDKYPNLIVRVGGFCARFVELDKGTQKEIVSRMLYGTDI